jgi:hypothetical protein
MSNHGSLVLIRVAIVATCFFQNREVSKHLVQGIAEAIDFFLAVVVVDRGT